MPIIAHLQLAEVVERAPIMWRMKRDLARWGYDATVRRRLLRELGWHAYEPLLATQRQLWVQAEDDVYLAADDARRQWSAWGEPPILWIPGGHMTFPLHLGTMTRRIAEFRRGL